MDLPDNRHSVQTWAGSVMKANDPSVPLISGFPPAGSQYSSEAGRGTIGGLVTSPSEASLEPAKGTSQQRWGSTSSEAVMSDLTTTSKTGLSDSVGSSTGRLPAPVRH